MTAGSIFLGLALLVLVGLFVTRPLWVPEERRQRRDSARRTLVVQKEALLAQLRVLDLDFETGKMPEDTYQLLRGQMMAEATAILKQLDELGAVAKSEPTLGSASSLDMALEAAVARRRGKAPTMQPVAATLDADAAIEAAVARRRQKAAGRPPEAQPTSRPTVSIGNGKAKFCPQCGQPADATDRFCAHCGNQLSQAQPI